MATATVDALVERLSRLEVISDPDNSSAELLSKTSLSAVDLLIQNYLQLRDILIKVPEVQLLLDRLPADLVADENEQGDSPVASDNTNQSIDLVVINKLNEVVIQTILAHASQINSLSINEDILLELTSSTLESPANSEILKSITDPNIQHDINDLAYTVDSLEARVSSLISRSVSLFEKLYLNSIVSVNESLVEVESRLLAAENKISQFSAAKNIV
ncbi:hypothetical protein V1511DRAFT_488823 [Dipodascopsis uninucleata]